MVLPSKWTIEYTKQVKLNDVKLEYEVFGSGEPVLLIHGALLGDSAIAPFQLYPPFMNKYQAIAYHRAGYGESTLPNRPVTIEQSAEHCRLLLQQIGVEKAHVIAHSYGGLIALQLAMSFPEVVHSLTLLEAFL
ncbi:MAG: alpha/beta fold hydrolase, partial [Candidatus Nanopelagicaceae bacterium]